MKCLAMPLAASALATITSAMFAAATMPSKTGKPVSSRRSALWSRITMTVLLLFGAGSLVTADAPVPPYDLLRAAEVKPGGWLKMQMQLDLREGITGNYDRISDNVNGHLFAKRDRRAGTMVVGNRGLQEKAWWAGEHEGYWKDSVVRMAFLAGDESFKAKARAWMEEILAAQKEDGYIGIYTPETRFPEKGFDGELWTQSRIFQAMLAYYEFTGDDRVLQAVDRAVQCTLAGYRNRTYFHRPNPDGGVAHGIGLMDTLEWLYRLTGKAVYREGAIWLYRDYASKPLPYLPDLMPQKLADPDLPWENHTPHILEGLHMPQIVFALGGGELFSKAADTALVRLARHTNPGGGFVGSENVQGRLGSGHMPGEYCSIAEGAGTLNRIAAWRGDLSVAAFVERMTLNAAQGARFHPANVAVTYLNCDNQRDASDPARLRGRFIYSASHKTAACCPLNAGRQLPYYVEGMWYRDRVRHGLAAGLYGACEVQTKVDHIPVRISEVTDYPFSDQIHFEIETAAAVSFPLILRIPDTASEIAVDAGTKAKVGINRKAKEIVIENTWQGSQTVNVDFKFQVELRKQPDGLEAYYQWGPLLFSLPLGERIEKTEELVTVSGHQSGFYDYRITATNTPAWDYQIDAQAKFKLVRLASGDLSTPWANPPMALVGKMRSAAGEPVAAMLKPYGVSKMRRTTFPVYGERQMAAKDAAGITGRQAAHTFAPPLNHGVFFVEFTWEQQGAPLAEGWSGIELTGEDVQGSFAGRPAGTEVFGLAGKKQTRNTRQAALNHPIKLIAKYDLDQGIVSLWIDPDITRTEATYAPDVLKTGFRAKSVRSVDTNVGPKARTVFSEFKVFTNGKTPFGD